MVKIIDIIEQYKLEASGSKTRIIILLYGEDKWINVRKFVCAHCTLVWKDLQICIYNINTILFLDYKTEGDHPSTCSLFSILFSIYITLSLFKFWTFPFCMQKLLNQETQQCCSVKEEVIWKKYGFLFRALINIIFYSWCITTHCL